MDTPQFRTIILFGQGGRYAAQLADLGNTVWGSTPEELLQNLLTAVQRLSPTARQEMFGPLLAQQGHTQRAG